MNSYYSPTFQRKAFSNAERKKENRQANIERRNPVIRLQKEYEEMVKNGKEKQKFPPMCHKKS